jgi:uncharacterized protein (TIGR02996 family)
VNDRQALLLAAIANPDEDTPRLALADWLEEHGDEHDRARAEFIRLQCQIARIREAAPSPPTIQLLARCEELQNIQGQAWLGPLWDMTGAGYRDRQFDRGLLSWWYADASEFLKKPHQDAVCEQFPWLGVALLMLTRKFSHVHRVAESPALGWVSAFSWRRSRLKDLAFRALATSPHTARISQLEIDHPHCTNAGLFALAESACWPNLRRLGLTDGQWGGRYTYEGIHAVLNSPHLPHLCELNLTGTQQKEVECPAFYQNEGWRRVRVLWRGPDVRIRDLAASPYFTALEEVHVNQATLTDDAVETLLANPAFAKLRKLTLSHINARTRPLSAAVEESLGARFGDGLKLEYSVQCL